MKTAQRDLTTDEAAALKAVRGGADVYDYGIAKTLRAIQKDFPTFIKIVPAVDPPKNGAAKQPYFGAITTTAGSKAADNF